MAGKKKAWKLPIKVWNGSKNKSFTNQAFNAAVEGSAIFLPLPRYREATKKQQPKDEEMGENRKLGHTANLMPEP